MLRFRNLPWGVLGEFAEFQTSVSEDVLHDGFIEMIRPNPRPNISLDLRLAVVPVLGIELLGSMESKVFLDVPNCEGPPDLLQAWVDWRVDRLILNSIGPSFNNGLLSCCSDLSFMLCGKTPDAMLRPRFRHYRTKEPIAQKELPLSWGGLSDRC